MVLDIEKILLDLLGNNGINIYSNDPCSVKIKMAKEEDVEPLAEFIHHHRQSDLKNEGDNEKGVRADLEKKLYDGIGDDMMPPSFYAIIATEEDNRIEHLDSKSSEPKAKERISGAAIITSDWSIKESINYINVEELFAPEESSATTNAMVLVLSAISLNYDLHMHEKNISILKYSKMMKQSESVEENDKEKNTLSSE
jgi:hypothetical protein